MNQINFTKQLCRIGCIVLALTMMLSFAGCGSSNAEGTQAPQTTAAATAEVTFTLVVTDAEGSDTTFPITTDKATVGEALLAEGLIAGEDSEFGLYVTTVNGITLDWDKDQMYWAFYIDGEYAQTGVDSTDVVDGAVYSFVAEG